MTPPDQPILNLTGEQVALGPLSREWLPNYWRWFNDLDVMQGYSLRWSPMSEQGIEQWYQQAIETSHTYPFTVYEHETMRPVGHTMLMNVNHLHRTADFDIIIGDKASWGRGYGTEATRLTLAYGFAALSLHNIMLTVRSFNKRGIRAYERAGFRAFGTRRAARRMGNQVYDLIYMECLATEFESPVLHRLLSTP